LIEPARRLGPGRVARVVADSSGNAGTAVAAYCARAGLDCAVYVPEATSPKKLEQIRAHGARLEVVPGDREAAARAARAAADEPDVFYASHVYNPHFPHGTKTYTCTSCDRTWAAGCRTRWSSRWATARCCWAATWR
jgi:threonine synthase